MVSAEIKEDLNRALRLHQSNNLLEAENLYIEILKRNPSELNALNLLGFLKMQINQLNEAILYLEKAVTLHPNFFEACFNLALAYKNNNELNKSIITYKKALQIVPESSETYFNLANIYENQLNDSFTAIEYYKKALEYNKKDSDNGLKYALGITCLKIKDFQQGWEYYEARLCKEFAVLTQTMQYRDKITSKPIWTGEDVKDKTLFVYYESGLGDTILFCRYLSLLKDKCAKVLFCPQICFTEFFKENNFGAEIIDSKTLPDEIDFDYHIPIMSIPYVLKLYTENVPLPEGYIKANIEKTKEYKDKYFNTNKLKVGIKWKGNTSYDLERVISLKSFYKLFDFKNIQFYSLQKGDGVEELSEIPNSYNVVDLGQTFKTFSDTAAAIENIDLVICNDTSVAHLAGAMGKPCWILLPYIQNWRWSTDTSYCYWYKSVKLFKQNKPGNWDEVFEEVLRELK